MRKYIFLSLVVFALYSGASAQEQGSPILSHHILLPADFNDGNVTFAIDTPTVSYKPYSGKGVTLSNSSPPAFRLFAYCDLQSDLAAKMKLVVDTSGVKVDTVELKMGQPVTFNFTLSTSLKPSVTQQIFPSRVIAHLLTLFQGIYIPFATDTVKFIATFPAYSSTGVANEKQDNISLSINPNPAIGQTAISLFTIKGESVTLEIYDMLGNRKAILASNEYTNGSRDFRFDATGFSPGIYFVRLQMGGRMITKKLIVE